MEEDCWEESMEDALENARDLICTVGIGCYYLFDWTDFYWNEVLDEEDRMALNAFNEQHLEEGIQAVFKNGTMHVFRNY